MKKKKEGFFIKEFKNSWDYIKKSKNYIYFSILVFLLFFSLGYLLPVPDSLMSIINKMISEIILKTENLVGVNLIGFIFFNNVTVSAFGLFFGVLVGIVPFILTISNGYVIGVILKSAVNQVGLSSFFLLLPHGMFELPAVFISLGLGLKLGMSLFNKNSDKEFLRRLKLSFKTLVFFIIPLLIIAAIIEGILITFFK